MYASAPSAAQAAALASHRFGLSEERIGRIGSDARGWVLDQWRAPVALDSSGLLDSREALRLTRIVLRNAGGDEAERRAIREGNLMALQQRWQHQISTTTPVHERWVMFWANHLTVAATKGTTQAQVFPYENEAIRPHIGGRFAQLLKAATVHPGMLLYLDNADSVGPHSRLGSRRRRGLNENLARELLELHTLGVRGGYTQADVTEVARILTGWGVGRADQPPGFQADFHEPGRKQVLGRSYPEGPQALDLLLNDLSRHPSTATHVAGRLVRHFVADDPDPVLVEAVARAFTRTDGDLPEVARALFSHDLTWRPASPGKVRRPEELLITLHRTLHIPLGRPERALATLTAMGQPVGRAPSPQGWPDTQDDWLGPDALLKRVEWAFATGRLAGTFVDARAVAEEAWGAALGDDTRTQLRRAESAPQALALLLASPEFQRR